MWTCWPPGVMSNLDFEWYVSFRPNVYMPSCLYLYRGGQRETHNGFWLRRRRRGRCQAEVGDLGNLELGFRRGSFNKFEVQFERVKGKVDE